MQVKSQRVTVCERGGGKKRVIRESYVVKSAQYVLSFVVAWSEKINLYYITLKSGLRRLLWKCNRLQVTSYSI